MMYRALVTARNGAYFELEFFGDNNELAKDHIRMVAADPSVSCWSRIPKGEIDVRFKRHYAANWIDAGKVVQS